MTVATSPRERMLAGLSATVQTLDADGVPTAVLWGRHDRMVQLATGEAAAARHGWPLHVVDGAAHAPHIEQPDAFVESLAAIIDPVSRSDRTARRAPTTPGRRPPPGASP